jgi:predicted nucleic acid-binding protein
MNSSCLCVDASLIIRLFVNPQSERVLQLWTQWDEEGRQIAAPTLLYYEVANAIYRYQRHGRMSSSAAQLTLEALLALPITLHGDAALHSRALVLAERLSLPAAYDAHYLALAERLGAELWTADSQLGHAARDTLSWVHVV